MKKLIFLGMFFLITSISWSQINFTVSPGFGLYGASVGYQFGDFVPLVGVAVVSGSSTVEENEMDYVDSTNQYIPVIRKTTVGTTIIMPYVGLKYFLGNTGNLKPYLSAIFWKPIFSTDYEDSKYPEDNGEEEYFDNLSILGVEAGFGTEYYFDKNFSIGGEFGFRMIFGSTETTREDWYYDDEGQMVYYDQKSKVSGLLDFTYSRFTLNFYF